MSSFGQILTEVGDYGTFQKRLLAALCIPSIFGAFNCIGQVFTDLNFPHHCNTDWILERGNLTDERRRNLTLPVNEDGRFESCRMFTPVDWDLETIEAHGINSTSECLHGWDYDAPKGVTSIVTEVIKSIYPEGTDPPQFLPFPSHFNHLFSSFSWTWFVRTAV